MKKLKLLSLVGITSIALTHAGLAAGHGGGGGGHFGGGGFHGGGFHGGGFGGGHAGGARVGGGHFGGRGGPHFGGQGFSGRPGYHYSRGMRFTNSRAGQLRSPVHRSPSVARPNRGITNSAMRQSRTSGRFAFNGRMGHIAERHDANWHRDWDRQHAHFFRNRFFVFDNGFWFGLDGYYPYDDYYAYDDQDYYGYDASTDPYSVSTVSAVQSDLAKQGYYRGVIDGVYGPQTRVAITRYQSNHGLQVTGSLTTATLQSLGLPQPMGS